MDRIAPSNRIPETICVYLDVRRAAYPSLQRDVFELCNHSGASRDVDIPSSSLDLKAGSTGSDPTYHPFGTEHSLNRHTTSALSRTANPKDIRAAYLRLASHLHPDKASNAAIRALSNQEQVGYSTNHAA